MHHYSNCPVCNSGGAFEPVLKVKDFTVSGEEFTITSCPACGFQFTNPRPEADKLGAYYLSENYISHSDTRKGFIANLYHAVRTYSIKQKVALVRRFVSRGTILDFGCGTGSFLSALKQAGFEVRGVEPSAEAGKICASKGLDTAADWRSLPGNETYDVITLWHVLEHVVDLRETLDFFQSHLKPGGVLIVAVPNRRSYDCSYYGRFWAAYDVPRHLYHFDRITMERLMQQFGFSLKQCLPMKFDSYYVSMLSEKYCRDSTFAPFKGAFRGLISNLKAEKPEDYSSVIHIFSLTK